MSAGNLPSELGSKMSARSTTPSRIGMVTSVLCSMLLLGGGVSCEEQISKANIPHRGARNAERGRLAESPSNRKFIGAPFYSIRRRRDGQPRDADSAALERELTPWRRS